MKILTVDDQPLILKSISNKLLKAGFILEFTFDGISAIQKYVDYNPDLLILDLSMPGKNGIEVIQDQAEKLGELE